MKAIGAMLVMLLGGCATAGQQLGAHLAVVNGQIVEEPMTAIESEIEEMEQVDRFRRLARGSPPPRARARARRLE